VAIADDGATTTLRDLDSGATRRSTFRFVIGCDGARSVVRRAIGATLNGDAVIQRVQSSFIRAPDLIDRQRHAPPGAPARSIRAAPAWSMRSTAANVGWCTII